MISLTLTEAHRTVAKRLSSIHSGFNGGRLKRTNVAAPLVWHSFVEPDAEDSLLDLKSEKSAEQLC